MVRFFQVTLCFLFTITLVACNDRTGREFELNVDYGDFDELLEIAECVAIVHIENVIGVELLTSFIDGDVDIPTTSYTVAVQKVYKGCDYNFSKIRVIGGKLDGKTYAVIDGDMIIDYAKDEDLIQSDKVYVVVGNFIESGLHVEYYEELKGYDIDDTFDSQEAEFWSQLEKYSVLE